MRRVFFILAFASLVLLLWQGTLAVRHYFIGNDKLMTRIDQMQRLQIFSRTGKAMYDDSVSRHKIGDRYTFTVYGKPYRHRVETPNPPQGPRFDVQYLPEDPNIQSIDPTAQLIMYRQQLAERKDEPALTWILILAGLGVFVYSGINLLRKP